MKVRCIDNGCASHELTVGKEYGVLAISTDCIGEVYLINNDENESCNYFKNRFEPVEDPKKGDENMKFKVGDKVINASGNKWCNGDEYKTIIRRDVWNGETRYELNNSSPYWSDYELKLWEEPQTEFTFQDVIARIKPGEVYIGTKSFGEFEAKIDLVDEGLRIRYFKDGVKISRRNGGIVLTHQNRWVLEEPKKRATIYKIEHKQGGKKYDFISSQLLQVYNFVVCDTTQGKSYGRIVGSEDRELTDEEIKQYKECWRA